MRVIRGKKALVTGAASGLGRAIALRLAREGVDLCLVDINHEGLVEVVAEVEALGASAYAARCDVSRPDEISTTIQEVLRRWGHVDILINSAGVAYYGPTVHMTGDEWNWLLAINLHAPIQFTRELLPTMLELPEAHVLNVASICGLVAGARFNAYNVSKFGLVGFSESLRADYGRQGLGVTALCPGPVLTDLFKSAPSGGRDRPTPTPPRLICTTVDRVAARAIRAIRRDQGLALVGWLANVLHRLKRFTPGLLDALQRIGRRRKMRKKAALLADRAAQPHRASESDRKAA